ncbi:hypothetical protein O5268_22840 [Escherichia coli]|nr:hypothetical protein [Escherichia coli]
MADLGLAGAKLIYFCDYSLQACADLRIEVPKDTDLNHFFEAMNNRGEQLVRHEVIKARLMETLNQIPGRKTSSPKHSYPDPYGMPAPIWSAISSTAYSRKSATVCLVSDWGQFVPQILPICLNC